MPVTTKRKSSATSTRSTRTTASSTRSTRSTGARISYTFKNGVSMTGTLDELIKVAETFGEKLTGISGSTPRGFYPSESKGLVRIADMNDFHLRRALMKATRDYFTGIYDKDETNRQFLVKYQAMANDTKIQDLFTELQRRVRLGL